MTSLYRRLVGAVCHPLHTVRAGSAWLLQRPLAADASRTWSRLWFDRRPLTDLHPVTAIDRGETLPRGVLATPDVRVSGSTRRAIVLTTPARLSYQTTADRRSTLALWLAVSPDTWADPSRSARVDVRIRAQGQTVAERSLTLAPARRWRDRRWMKIAADVHGPTAVDVEAHADPGAVTIAIGDPHVASPRSWAEVRVLAAAFARRLARGGVRDTRRWARQTQRRETDADYYHAWCAAHTPDRHALDDMALRVPSTPDRPRFSILVPTYNTPDVLLEACVESVRAQVYPEWELVIADDGSTREETRRLLRRYEANEPRLRVVWNADNRGIAANTQSALAQATGEFVGLLDADDVLLPHALFRVAEAILARPDVDVVYSDEDKLELDGTRSDPYFKPDWSPDLFLSSMYACHFLVLRRSVVEVAGGFRSAFDGSQDYDLVLRVMERTDRIAHVPDVLYHWRKTPASASSTGAAKPWAFAAGQRALQDYADRNGLDAIVEQGGTPGLYRMHYRLRATPPVTVVVPILRPADRVASLLAARLGRAHYPDVELILAGPHRREIEAIAAQATRAVRAIAVEGTLGRVLNAGAAAAGGALLLFVAPWIEPLDDDWIAALVEHAQRPGVGIVGGKTFYPDGRLRHMGLIVGAHGLAGRPFDGYAGTWGGYFGNADAVRNCRAVSRACLMTRKTLFDDAGGFDETLRADGLDLDYALRLGARGQRTLYTPFARVVEHVPYEAPPPPLCVEDVEHLRTRWGPALEADPYYNFHFVAADPDYRIRT